MEAKKDIEATPELLGNLLLVRVVEEIDILHSICEEYGIKVNESQDVKIFQELFIFYFSLFLLVLSSRDIRDINDDEMKEYGKLFLTEARIALFNSELPNIYKEWILDENLFIKIFDRDFRFYYHDQIPFLEKEPLEEAMQLCRCEKENTLQYWAVKFQYQICKILNVLTDILPFMRLWGRCSAIIPEFVSMVLADIRPVLK